MYYFIQLVNAQTVTEVPQMAAASSAGAPHLVCAQQVTTVQQLAQPQMVHTLVFLKVDDVHIPFYYLGSSSLWGNHYVQIYNQLYLFFYRGEIKFNYDC